MFINSNNPDPQYCDWQHYEKDIWKGEVLNVYKCKSNRLSARGC